MAAASAAVAPWPAVAVLLRWRCYADAAGHGAAFNGGAAAAVLRRVSAALAVTMLHRGLWRLR